MKIALASGTDVEVGRDSSFGSGGVGIVTSDRTVARDALLCGPYESIEVHSPVLGVAPGSATISARLGDPPTVTSTASGGDATFVVTAP